MSKDALDAQRLRELRERAESAASSSKRRTWIMSDTELILLLDAAAAIARADAALASAAEKEADNE